MGTRNLRHPTRQARRARCVCWCLLCVAWWLTPQRLRAETVPHDDARKHFDLGVQQYGNGEPELALEQFERAYQRKPHYAVLYNMGQAHIALGHPVEAVRAWRQYLSEGGARIDLARREQVMAAISLQEKRIGILELVGDLDQVDCEMDGNPMSRLPRSLPLAAGRHVVVARRQGYDTQLAVVDVPARGTVTLAIALTVKQEASAVPQSWLRIDCSVPDVMVHVDAVTKAKTPIAEPLPLPSGRHTVNFVRQGYVPSSHVIDLRPSQIGTVKCDATPNPLLRIADGGSLSLTVNEADAQIEIDGLRFSGQKLPLGRHRVEVRKSGFVPWSAETVVTPHRPTQLSVALVPTPEYGQQYTSAAKRERMVAYVASATGIVASVASISLLAHNASQFDRWQADREQLVADAAAGMSSTELGARVNRLSNDEARILRIDHVAYALAAVGGVMLATATGLFVWGKDPHRYAVKRTAVSKSAAIGNWLVEW